MAYNWPSPSKLRLEINNFQKNETYFSDSEIPSLNPLGWENLWVLLNHVPISIHLHPALSTSTQLISASTQLHPPPPSSFKSPPSSLQHPQQYLNQIIACNWAISPNLGWKIRSCLFWLKIGTQGVLQVLIPNPDLEFWNSNPKIHFWANFGPKIQSSPFCLKIGTHSILGMLIPNPGLDLWSFDPKILFWANLGPKIQSFLFYLKIGTHRISRMLIRNPDLDFRNFDPKIHFWAKSQRCPFGLKIATHGISSMLILIPTLVIWISNPNDLFGQIWAKNVNVVCFNWKLAHMVSWKWRFWIRT